MDPNTPAAQLFILSERVKAITVEKEKLEADYRTLNDRVLKMESTFNKGAGMLLLLPFLGTATMLVITWGGKLFGPWIGKQ
jgi:hypothetical protein